jgi:hypothetical protein
VLLCCQNWNAVRLLAARHAALLKLAEERHELKLDPLSPGLCKFTQKAKAQPAQQSRKRKRNANPRQKCEKCGKEFVKQHKVCRKGAPKPKRRNRDGL